MCHSVTSIVLSPSDNINSLLRMTLCGRCFGYLHFTDEESEAQKGQNNLARTVLSGWTGTPNPESLAPGSARSFEGSHYEGWRGRGGLLGGEGRIFSPWETFIQESCDKGEGCIKYNKH